MSAARTPASSTSSSATRVRSRHAHRDQPRERLVPDHRARGRDARLHHRRQRRQRRRPGRHRDRRAHGGIAGRVGGGAVYVSSGGRTRPTSTPRRSRSPASRTIRRPGDASTLGSRYDGFQQDSHTGMSLAALPDVNGDGYRDLVVGAPDAALHRPGGGGVAVLYGKPQGVHITLNDLWENAYPYFFHVDFPALDDQNIGTSVASVGDMTGDGQPDIAIGAPHADSTGDGLRLGLDHQRPPPADRRLHAGVARGRLPVDPAQPPHGRAGLPHRRRRAGRSARARLWRASETRTATASATSRSAPRAPRPTVAPDRARSSSSRGRATRRRATSP